MKSEPVGITAIWSRRIGDRIHTLAEIDGRWRLLLDESVDSPFSHIREARSFVACPLDPITEERAS